MEAKKYLENSLKSCTKYRLTDLDKKYLEENEVDSFIYKKLTSKKFRKWAIDEDSQNRVKGAIKINMERNGPIQFTFPFGGYKLWRLPTAPEVDWAEFFTIKYYCNYIAPILRVYKPGVKFSFSSDDLIIERMDNIPKKDTNAYFDSFVLLISEFSKYFPDNMQMEIKRVSDLYNEGELEAELSMHIARLKKEYPGQDEQRKKKMLQISELNIKMDGVENWAELNEQERNKKISMGPIYHDAQCSLVKRRAFVRGENKVVIFTTKISNAIAIGTTKTSITKFWTGYGVLERYSDRFKDRILSPKQLQSISKKKISTEKIKLIPLGNFNNIKIIDMC